MARDRSGNHSLVTFACGLLLALPAGCTDAGEDGDCGCGGPPCWECAYVGGDLTSAERTDYTLDTVLELAEGVWEGTHPDALDGSPIQLRATVEGAEGGPNYRAARVMDPVTCELPDDAEDRCAGMLAPARVEILADPVEFSFTASDLQVYGRTLTVPGDQPGARNFDGFPEVNWEVFTDDREFNMFLLFSADGRLWLKVDEGTSPPFVEIGEKL